MEKQKKGSITPQNIAVSAGKTYYWCMCGLSDKHPFCDGSHKGSPIRAVAYTPPVDQTVIFCGCTESKMAPLCDGENAGTPCPPQPSDTPTTVITKAIKTLIITVFLCTGLQSPLWGNVQPPLQVSQGPVESPEKAENPDAPTLKTRSHVTIAGAPLTPTVPLLRIVTSIPPLEMLARAVGGAHVETFSLVKGGGSPHFVQIRPSFTQKMREADLILTMGESLEPFIDATLQKLSLKNRWVRVSRLKGLVAYTVRTRCCGPVSHKTPKHWAHDNDQHAWLSPVNALLLVDWMARRFSEKRPDLKAVFHQNAQVEKEKIRAGDRANKNLLKTVAHVPFVVVHDGYQYLEKHYGLHHGGVVFVSGEAGGRPQRLAELVTKMREDSIKCIFKEAQLPSTLAHKIAREVDGTVITLDPLSGDTYTALMGSLSQSIHSCLTKQMAAKKTSPGKTA